MKAILIVGLLASALVFAENASVLMEVRNSDVLQINGADGKKLVVINMKTGKATLYGDPNEAARTFWQATAAMGVKCR